MFCYKEKQSRRFPGPPPATHIKDQELTVIIDRRKNGATTHLKTILQHLLKGYVEKDRAFV